MSLKIADNFKYQGKKPLDDRMFFKTLEEMRSYSEFSLPNLAITLCEETEKLYIFNVNNSVDEITGRWREHIGGISEGGVGNGSIYIETLDEIQQLNNISVGQFIYVENDSSNNGDSSIYVVESVTSEKKVDEYNNLSAYVKSSIPKLSYSEDLTEGTKIYKNVGDELILIFKFDSSTYGNGTYKIYRDGKILKTIVDSKGTVIVNLGKMDIDGAFEYTVTATDYLGTPAPETLRFNVICGGLKLASTFEDTINKTIFELDSPIRVPYSVSCADLNAEIKILCKISNNVGYSHTEIYNIDNSSLNGTLDLGDMSSQSRGLYTLSIQAYTGTDIEDTTDGTFTSSELIYTFNILQKNEIAITGYLDISALSTQNQVVIPFKAVSKVSNFLLTRGNVYKKENDDWQLIKTTPDTGIRCTVNVMGYWNVEYLEEGEYRYELTAETLDGGIQSLETFSQEFTVVHSEYTRVEPIKSNLLCYFDANKKTNSDIIKDTWYNDESLDQSYYFKLHNLNYNNNGWVHVDESLSESDIGERMLKFTGDSYGELIRYNNGKEERYSPLSIFKNGGVQGFALEVVFRTRCVGEINTRVITCQEEDTDSTCGVGVKYNKMVISSDSQATQLDFAEDEWIHATFVIDRNIRTAEDVGIDTIENMNPMGTMRMYINGSLCSVTGISTDKFLDPNDNSFPLMLNSCLKYNMPTNFGECEIKMIRIYNNFLTSTDVLNNYISSIYDLTEQQDKKDKNDLSKSPLPSITFKRKLTSTNNSTFKTLNSITDKATSKKYCVDCVMEYNDGKGNITIYDNVDVYLQGTSSLQYPVKNYKIKCYKDDGHTTKNKITVPEKEDEWSPDSTFTLKCDYMEGSHLNNTPTAIYYDKVVEALGGQSPARRDGYRDSIDGFPCIVYYADDFDKDGATLVGSFMFNLDKSGKDLGFECDLYDDEGNKVGSGKNSCLSYEATANASDTAGCFYSFSQSVKNVYKYYVEDSYGDYMAKHPSSDISLEQFTEMINNGQVDYYTYAQFLENYDEIDYIMSDFELRYDCYEKDETKTDEDRYAPMLGLVNWVSQSIEDGTFKRDFEEHLDLTYMLTYYLQMWVFAQVDNCGRQNCFSIKTFSD